MQVDWAAWMAQSDNYEGMVCLFADGYLSEEHLPYIVKEVPNRERFAQDVDAVVRKRKKSARSIPNPS